MVRARVILAIAVAAPKIDRHVLEPGAGNLMANSRGIQLGVQLQLFNAHNYHRRAIH